MNWLNLNKKNKKNKKKIVDRTDKLSQEKFDKVFKNCLKYEYREKKGKMIIDVNYSFDKPKMTCDYGDICAKITIRKNKCSFKFSYADLPKIDGISSKIKIVDGEYEYFLSEFTNDKKYNYNNVENVYYENDFVYYLRNTFTPAGHLIIQKKRRLYFEDEHFEERIAKAHNEYIGKETKYVVFYEKFGMRFEESSAKVFERVAHYENVYYILDENSPNYKQLKGKYGNKIVTANDEKFLELIYLAKFYIGTEIPFHMFGLRSPYKLLRKEAMKTNKHKFIFLQHGVMYALSLKPKSRDSFKKNGIHKPYRVVVSSELEADHLCELGKYKRHELWKTGLATFDGKKSNDYASKVTIMLTWRPWDEQKIDVEETTYYHALTSILDSLEDKSNVQIAVHPKVLELKNNNTELLKYQITTNIDEALNDTKVLITDYSSVSFDAFYRGSNVVFWWVQKEACLEKYNNDLLLNEENIFGDIVYSNDQLNEVIASNISRGQTDEYINRYRQIVEFYDNNNTDRIYECLLGEGVFDSRRKVDTLEVIGLLEKLGCKNAQLLNEALNRELTEEEYSSAISGKPNYLVKSLFTKLQFADSKNIKREIMKEMYEIINNNTNT